MRTLKTVALWLLIIGGLAWGYEGVADQDVFALIAGDNHPIEIIFDLAIGLAAIVVAYDTITKKA